MDLEHRFAVAVPLDTAWAALEDLPSIAPCFPGAEISDFDGEAFTGSCRVKLGPVSLQYQGSGRFVDRDAESRRAVVEIRGKERRGNGTAAATITTTMSQQGESTAVAVTTRLTVTGRPAQFGRGMMQEVGDKLLSDFAGCLEQTLAAAGTPTADQTAHSEPAQQAAEIGSTPPTVPAELELGGDVLAVVLRRSAPYLALGAAAVAVLLIVLRRRH